MTGPHDRPFDDDTADELSLKPLLQTVWSYRRFVLIVVAMVTVAYLAGFAFLYAASPTEQFASIPFQLTFEGADRDVYPNGTKFSSAEIVSTPVLTEVFAANELQRYGSFSDFKDTMFVVQSNHDLELLSYEYDAKLADTKLGPIDRTRLEEEFRRKRDSLRSAQYSLNMRRRESLVRLPPAMMNKILTDTLATWAKAAAQRKGATGYDIPILTRNVLRRDLQSSEDYIVTVDILRTKVERILKSVVDIERIPGASAVRMGTEQIGLADLRASLEDIVRFRIEPLIGIIRNNGLSRNTDRMDQYLRGRQFEVHLAQSESTQRIKTMQDALNAYEQRATPEAPSGSPSVTPQVGDSFIDKLVQLSTKSVDIEYRQDLTKRVIDEGLALAELNRQAEYYTVMLQSFTSARGSANAALAADVNRQTEQIFADVARLMDQVQAIYTQIAQQNLNPSTVLYAFTGPFSVRKVATQSLSTALLYFVVTLVVAAVVAILAGLAHSYFRHWISPSLVRGPKA